MICWKCKADIGEFDKYCKYCGTGQGENVSFYYKIWGIIILFFFIGPFALYFVVRSPLLKKWTKWVISILMLAVSIWFIYSFVIALQKVFAIYMDLLNMTIY